MAQLPGVFLAALLAVCGASPVLHQLLDQPRLGDAADYTSGAAGSSSGTSGASGSHASSRGWQDSSKERQSSEERTRHPELNTVHQVSGWSGDSMDNEVWSATVSESSSAESKSLYEDDAEYESPPPLTDHKLEMETTDEPPLTPSDSDQVVKYRDTPNVMSRNESNTSKTNYVVDVKGEKYSLGNTSKIGFEFGSKQFEDALGDALTETLHKMKMVLAAEAAIRRREEDLNDWSLGLSRLRVKRSEEEESEEDVSSALDELPINSLNDIVDLFVILARQALEERRLDQVSIPPLEQNFSRSLGVGTLRGFFRGDGGWVRRLTTVRRLGDVWLHRGALPPGADPREGRSVSVATSLGLEELTVGFERYVADVRYVPTVSGRLLADIEENAVLLNISFSKKDDDPKGCDVNLLHLRVLQLNGINMKLTGLGPLNWLLSRIATWLTTHSQEKVAKVVERELTNIANKEIGRIPCDADFITALYML